MLRFLIADDHEIIRRGLRQILQEEFPSAHFDEAGDTGELINKGETSHWDIIISDLAMPGGGGLEALRYLQIKTPQIPVLILSIYPQDQYAMRVMKEGAAGYLNKDAAPEELVTAVQKILNGRKYLTPEMAEKLSSSKNTSPGGMVHELLSEREFNVFHLLVTGHSIAQIAESLSLGPTTVSTYRARILQKMQMKSNAELILYAIENRLI